MTSYVCCAMPSISHAEHASRQQYYVIKKREICGSLRRIDNWKNVYDGAKQVEENALLINENFVGI